MARLRDTLLFNDANLEAYYEFNSSGALTTDSSSNAVTLTNFNSSAYTASGKYGGAVDFGASNTNQYLKTTNNLGIDGGAISIVGWIKLNAEIASGNWYFFFQENVNTDVGYFIDYSYSGGTRTLSFWRIREGAATAGPQHVITLGTTNWYHLALTYDGTNVRAYVNGSLVESPVADTGNGSGGQDGFSIGGSLGASAFSSLIADDVAVFSRALTADEVANLASATGTTTSTSSSTSTTTTSTSTTTTSTSTTTTSTSTTTTSTSSSTSSSSSSSTSTTTTSTSTTTTSTSTTTTSTSGGLVFYIEYEENGFIVDHPGS